MSRLKEKYGEDGWLDAHNKMQAHGRLLDKGNEVCPHSNRMTDCSHNECKERSAKSVELRHEIIS